MDNVQKANSIQPGGSHYRPGAAYQHWDYVADTGMDYFAANATKYICRYRDKGGALDLTKALHYIRKLGELEQSGKLHLYTMRPGPLDTADALYKLSEVYNLSDAQQMAVRLLTIWHDRSDLQHADRIVSQLFAECTAAPPLHAERNPIRAATATDEPRQDDNPHHGHDNSGGRD